MGWPCNPSLSTNNVQPSSCPLTDMWRHLQAEACHRNHNELLFALFHDRISFFVKSTKAAAGLGHPGRTWKLTPWLTASFRQIRLHEAGEKKKKLYHNKNTLPYLLPGNCSRCTVQPSKGEEIYMRISPRSALWNSAAGLHYGLGHVCRFPSLRDETVTFEA